MKLRKFKKAQEAAVPAPASAPVAADTAMEQTVAVEDAEGDEVLADPGHQPPVEAEVPPEPSEKFDVPDAVAAAPKLAYHDGVEAGIALARAACLDLIVQHARATGFLDNLDPLIRQISTLTVAVPE